MPVRVKVSWWWLLAETLLPLHGAADIMRKGQDGSYMNLPVARGVLGNVQHFRLHLCMQTYIMFIK